MNKNQKQYWNKYPFYPCLPSLLERILCSQMSFVKKLSVQASAPLSAADASRLETADYIAVFLILLQIAKLIASPYR